MCLRTENGSTCEGNIGKKQDCDLDIFLPPFDSEKRCSSVVVSIFNLVATIVGGGVLSMPLAFEKCGIVLATFLMVFSALATDRSLYLLCLCSRYTGATSFGEVGGVAFGTWMECVVSMLLFIFLLFVLVAFMILVRDIWTPLVNGLFLSDVHENIVLFTILVLMSPFLTRRTLYALRFNCYFGFASASILCAGICHHVWHDGSVSEVKFLPSSTEDALYGFPIITLGFLSSFNILPVHSSLTQPTKKRLGYVLNGAIGCSTVITYIFGLAGYLYYGSLVKGNIINNLDELDDWVIMLGRLGYGTTLMLALAILTLPCRSSILEVIDRLRGVKRTCDETATKCTESKESLAEEGSPLLRKNEDRKEVLLSASIPLVHYGSTFLIISMCFFVAVAVPGVDVVWNLCGSCMAFLLSFILPTTFYLRIHSQQRNKRVVDYIGGTGISYTTFSWVLLWFAVIGSVACTVQSALLLL